MIKEIVTAWLIAWFVFWTPLAATAGQSIIISSSTTTATDYSSSSLTKYLLYFEEASAGAYVDEVNGSGKWTETGTTSRGTTSPPQGSYYNIGDGATDYQTCSGADCNTTPAADTDFSFGCWAMITTEDASNNAHFQDHSQTGKGFRAYIRPPSSGRDLRCEFRGATTQTVGVTDGAATNTWRHLVCTHDDKGANNTDLYAYEDGAVVGSSLAVAWEYVAATGSQNAAIPSSQNGFVGQLDECFLMTGVALSNAQVCQICSCGFDGTGCTCSGTSYSTSGRNTTTCGSCTLPDCNAAVP